MNPLKDEIFVNKWNIRSETITKEQEELVKDNKPTLDQVVEFVADSDNSSILIDKLYFIYTFLPISNHIGWYEKPDSMGIGGFLKLEFYNKLLQAVPKYESKIFSYLPTPLQTEDMLINYLKNHISPGTPSLNNYHGDKLKTSTLEWIIDNKLGLIREFKPEWWTPKLKTRAIKIDTAAIMFIPEDLLTKTEIIDYLKNGNKNYLNQFWRSIPDTFKKDPEIFARWLALNGGLSDQYKHIYTTEFYTLENIKKYYELTELPKNGDWKLIKKEWKHDLIDVALPKVGGAIALDTDIELTNSILDRTIKSKRMTDFTKAKIAKRLDDEGRLTSEIVEKLQLNYWGIDSLMETDSKKLLKNDNVLDYLVKIKDPEFLRKKTNWPKGKKIKKEHVIDLIIGLQFKYEKCKQRLIGLTEDDYVWVFFKAGEEFDIHTAKKIRYLLKYLVDQKNISISEQTLNILDEMKDTNATYDSFKSATDIFMF